MAGTILLWRSHGLPLEANKAMTGAGPSTKQGASRKCDDEVAKILADKRLLAKHINNIYLAKGSMASYDFLFRILYSEDIEIAYPKDNMIAPSDSKWIEYTVVNLHSTRILSLRDTSHSK